LSKLKKDSKSNFGNAGKLKNSAKLSDGIGMDAIWGTSG